MTQKTVFGILKKAVVMMKRKFDPISYMLGQASAGSSSDVNITSDTKTSLTGILKGNGTNIGVQTVDNTPTSESINPVTSGGVFTELSKKADAARVSVTGGSSGSPVEWTYDLESNTTQLLLIFRRDANYYVGLILVDSQGIVYLLDVAGNKTTSSFVVHLVEDPENVGSNLKNKIGVTSKANGVNATFISVKQVI